MRILHKNGRAIIQSRGKPKARGKVILKSGDERYTDLDRADFEAQPDNYPVLVSDDKKMTVTVEFVKAFLIFKENLE